MENTVKIALIQANLVWEDIPENLNKFSDYLNRVPFDTELIILPEMFATGFSFATDFQENPIGKNILEWLQEKAKTLQKILIGSILFEDNKHLYNRMFWVTSNGTFDYYDKRHLFHMGGEHKFITGGKQRVIVPYNNSRFLLQVCYDLRFPVASKNNYNPETNQYDYDTIIYIANWPELRKEAYMTLLKARAIENQVYVVWVNRVGSDTKGFLHSGDTQVIDPMGKIVALAEPHKETLLSASLDFERLQSIRENFKVGLDWDSFTVDW